MSDWKQQGPLLASPGLFELKVRLDSLISVKPGDIENSTKKRETDFQTFLRWQPTPNTSEFVMG